MNRDPFDLPQESECADEDTVQDDLDYLGEDSLDWTEEEERGWAQQDKIDLYRNEY